MLKKNPRRRIGVRNTLRTTKNAVRAPQKQIDESLLGFDTDLFLGCSESNPTMFVFFSNSSLHFLLFYYEGSKVGI